MKLAVRLLAGVLTAAVHGFVSLAWVDRRRNQHPRQDGPGLGRWVGGTLALVVLAGGPAMAQSPPAITLVTAPLISPSAAWSYYGGGSTHTAGLAASASTPPEISALARSLGSGRLSAVAYSQNVFDYVRNNIAPEFRFGLGKGGLGALIDQSGTPFDQAELMVKLLRQGGVTANYQVGVITLTDQQFGRWSGFVSGLDQTAQTVTVNAKAACQLLADGGIPAIVNGSSDCTSLSGNLSTVTLGHVWVQANGLLYDPAFKRNLLKAGIDIPAAMGCGTAASPTCGANAVSAAMNGATQGTLGGAATITNINTTALNAQLQASAVALQGAIQSANRNASLIELIGGAVVDTSYSPTPASSLPYTATAQYTWTGDIPDQFRSTLSINYPGSTTALNKSVKFYGDELSGHGLYFGNNYDSTWHIRIDNADVFTSTDNCCANLSYVKIQVDHPYVANSGSYADDIVDVTGAFRTSLTTFFTLVATWGDSSATSVSYYSDKQQSNIPKYIRCTDAYYNKQAFECVRFLDQHLITASGISFQQSAADKVESGVSGSRTTRQHMVGVITDGLGNLYSQLNVSLAGMVSINNKDALSASRGASFIALTNLYSMIEGSALQQERDVAEANSTTALFNRSNVDHTAFVDVPSGQMATVLPLLTNYTTDRKSWLSSIAAAGYELIIPQSGMPSCAYWLGSLSSCSRYGGDYGFKSDSISMLVAESLKGGASGTGVDPTNAALNTVQKSDHGLLQKKFRNVDLASGALSITPSPDLVSGAGDFPSGLPLVRSYRSGTRSGQWSYDPMCSGCENDPPLTGRGYQGADSFALGTLGGDWTHNYQIAAVISNDGSKALGEDRGLDAASAIAATFTMFDINRTVSFQNRLASSFSSFWLGQKFMSNVVQIHNALSTESFVRLPDGTFNPPKGGTGSLVMSVGPTPLNNTSGTGSGWGYIAYQAAQLSYTSGGGDVMSFTKCRMAERIMDVCAGVLPITKWTFTNGLSVTFEYQPGPSFGYSDSAGNHICCVGVGQLTKVSNNLGRSLNFGYTSYPDPTGPAGTFYRSRIVSVTSDTGQQATYQTSGCGSSPYDLFFCSTLSVTTSEGTTKYDYVAGPDSPDPAVVAATPNYRLRRIFFPLTPSVASLVFAYDDKGRVASITDALGHQSRYFPAGLASTEAWKRAESVNPLGVSTISTFDDHNNLVQVTDPLGRTATTTYDNAGRKLTETHPEGDSATYTYDVRSNLLTTTRYPKPGSSLPSIVTSATYGEGATVFPCANWKTCNKPLTETDARGYVSNYSWEAATGFPSQILKPADAAGVRPQTDFSYTGYTATDGATLRLLTGKTDKVSASQNIVTTYAYDAANKFVLKSATTDPGGVAATICFQFDAIGNLVGTTDPRASACP